MTAGAIAAVPAGAAASTILASALTAPPASIGGFDFAGALARWRAASAKVNVAFDGALGAPNTCWAPSEDAEAALNAAQREENAVKDELLAMPASPAALIVKLHAFKTCWTDDNGGDENAGVDELEDIESPAVQLAIGIALDLERLIRAASSEPAAGALQPLAAIAASIGAHPEEARS